MPGAVQKAGSDEVGSGWRLLGLAADVFADHLAKTTFGRLSELVIVRRLLAHYEASATVTGIKPLRGRSRRTVRAVKSYASPHLDEGAALWQLGGIFVFHTNECRPLIILENPHRAHRHLIAGFGLADGTPFAGGSDKRHQQNGDEHHGDDEEGLFQCKLSQAPICSTTLRHRGISVNPVVKWLSPPYYLVFTGKKHGNPSFNDI